MNEQYYLVIPANVSASVAFEVFLICLQILIERIVIIVMNM